jgi:hypothetical protein
MQEPIVINIEFASLGGPTYIGRSNGEAARRKIGLATAEDDILVSFNIDIPDSTYNINSSYFLGLFGDSIRKSGSAGSFLARYRFETHGKSYRAIERGVERALLQDKGLGIA